MKTAQRHHGFEDLGRRIQEKKGNPGDFLGYSAENGAGVQLASGNGKVRMATQGADQQLRLQAIGTGDEDRDGIGSGGGRRRHKTELQQQKKDVAIVGRQSVDPQGNSHKNLHTAFNLGNEVFVQ